MDTDLIRQAASRAAEQDAEWSVHLQRARQHARAGMAQPARCRCDGRDHCERSVACCDSLSIAHDCTGYYRGADGKRVACGCGCHHSPNGGEAA